MERGGERREGKGWEEGRSVKVTISIQILIVTWRVVSCTQKDVEHHQCRVKWYMNSPCNFVFSHDVYQDGSLNGIDIPD